MREEAEWMTNNEGLIEKILANTGKNIRQTSVQRYNSKTGEMDEDIIESFGFGIGNNTLEQNFNNVNQANSELYNAVNLLSEYQNVMQAAIKANNNFGLSLDGKSWQEQIKILAESDQWDNFISSVHNAGSRFEGTAANVKKASENVAKRWDEIVNDDLRTVMLTLQEHLHTSYPHCKMSDA